MITTSYITYQCNTCKREIDIEQDMLRVFINKCSITEGCSGKLSPLKTKKTRNILTTSLDTSILNKHGNSYVEDLNTIKSEQFYILNSGIKTLTLAVREIDKEQNPLPARLNLRFNVNSANVVNYDEYVFRIANTKVITGKDNSALQKVLKFTSDDNMSVYVNGQLLDETLYTKGYAGTIGTTIILENMIYSLSTVKIIIYKSADITYTNYLEFFENQYITSFETAWKNVNYIVKDGKSFKLYSTNQIINLPLNSRLNIYPGDNDAITEDNESFFVLANPHYTPIDRILSCVVPLTNFINDENYAQLVLQNSNYMLQSSIGCVVSSKLIQPILLSPDELTNLSAVDNSIKTNNVMANTNIIGIS